MGKIVVNAGHYPYKGQGYDPGAVNPRLGITEASMTRVMAYKVKTELIALGYAADDILVWGAPTLKGITDYANRSGAECFVSLHFNAHNGKSRGVEVFTYRDDQYNSIALAEKIYNNIKTDAKEMKFNKWWWRGMKRAGFYVNKYTKMPSCLVEMGFIDNDDEARMMLGQPWQKMMSKAIAKGIDDFVSNH